MSMPPFTISYKKQPTRQTFTFCCCFEISLPLPPYLANIYHFEAWQCCSSLHGQLPSGGTVATPCRQLTRSQDSQACFQHKCSDRLQLPGLPVGQPPPTPDPCSPSSSTTCRRTAVGMASGSSSDFPSLSSDFHDSSCSAKAIARGNSRGRECKTSTAPGGGDTPKKAQKEHV